ncbi:serine/threonine-protein kinase [Pseudanabaena sp. FACHB-2040]|uniref:serine/threonine-protein kinase n=1 Tax=Pseudanabaena sp. FACHB-2040 TaxID=2692859 RepID=UPI0016898D8D|nr:serine/threonine-protein kinase [Pseudanabaena sp. FACHB-2040]MBD2258813.1 tetratricopeptide repeat protein [Pseudanabaena sp. FACHB-2040]
MGESSFCLWGHPKPAIASSSFHQCISMLNQAIGGRYQILSYLGGGGFGQTYLAEDRHLPDHPCCVVKQLKPQKADEHSLDLARRLFDAEARALYQLGTHECIPRLLAHFEESAQFYLVQEYIEGTLLSDELQETGLLDEAATIELLINVLNTLNFVHQQQVIHRDIKPSNLIRRHSDGKIVLIDFGSVKQVSGPVVEPESQVSMTVAIGSLGYMPNEQLAGQPSLSSDIYAVGMLALQALTGVDPKRLSKDPRTSEVSWHDLVSVSPTLQAVLDKMIRYDHRQRYSSAQETLSALESLATTLALASHADLTPVSIAQSGYSAWDTHLAWLERGDDLFSQNRYQEAIAAYEKVLQLQPSHDAIWFKQGLAYEGLGNYEAAVTSYDRVLQLRPEDYLAWLKRAKALEALERYDGALAAYDEVLRIQSDNYWVWCDRAQVLEKLGRGDDALAAYERAVQLQPDFVLALERRKQILQSLQRVEQLYQLQHYDEAIAACDRTIESDAEDSDAWLMRAMALENLQRLREAALSYERVVRLQPDDHVAWFKLGTVLEKLDHPRHAVVAYSQVTRIQPDNYWAWYQRGQALEKLESFKQAMTAYNRAIQLKSDFRSALTARQQLINRLLSSPVMAEMSPSA